MKKQLALLLVPVAAAWLSVPANADVMYGTAGQGPFVGGNSGGTMLDNDFYQYDDGSTENAVGFGGAVAELMWLHSFVTDPNFATITAVSTSFGSPFVGNPGVVPGQPVDVYVYEDNDMDPTNGITLVGHGVAPIEAGSIDTDVLQKIVLDANVTIGTSHFWVAALVHQEFGFPAPLDQSQASNGRAWITGDTTGNFDPNNLNGNSFPPADEDVIAPGVWLLRANAIPAPGALALLGLAGLAARRRRRA